jgi:peptide/nickel transport system substrate-binding protein
LKRKYSFKVSALLIMVIIAASLVLNPDSVLRQANAQQESTLRLGITTFPDSFNPLTFIMTESSDVLSMIYDMGIQMEGPKGTPVADLAESWEVSPDGLTWTFHFVHNATWHDGVPFTSADFKFTLDYCTDYPNFNETLQQPMVISYMSTIASTETPDPYTAIVHMNTPLADFGQPFFWIIPKHIWENVPKLEAGTTYKNMPPIGTGPFKYSDSKLNEYVKLDANKDYFRGAPSIDHILFKYYADPDTMVQALITGEVDAIIPPTGSVEKLSTEKNINIAKWPSRSISELGFNTWSDPSSKGNPALKDYRFRQALGHAVNKTEIIKLAYHGLAEPGESVLTPTMTPYYWHPSPEETLDFNTDKANKMLDDLGYTQWDDSHTYRIDPTTNSPFMLNCYVTNDATELISAGTLIINWFKEIGIGLQLRVVESAQMIDTNLAGGMDTYLWGWGFDADPDFALSVFTTNQIGSWSDCFYSNATYDALYEQQHSAVNPQQRQQTITEMQKFLYNEAPYVVLAYSLNIEAYRTDMFTGWVDQTQNPGWDVYWWSSAGALMPITATTTTAVAAAGPGVEMYIAAIAVAVIVVAVGAAMVIRRQRAARKEQEEAD